MSFVEWNKYNKAYGVSVIFFLLVTVFFCIPAFVSAATLDFSPSGGSYSAGETFTVRAQVAPEGSEALNAVEAEISFDNTILSVIDVTKDGSVFSLWTAEPTFSNNNGSISFGGGSPTPFTDTSTLVTITFRTLIEGTAEVTYDSGSVLAADGLGTDVLSARNSASFTVSETVAPPPPDPEPEPVGDLPNAPVVTSDTHPDPDTWYSETTALYKWELEADTDAVRLLIGNEPIVDPTVTYSPPLIQREIDDLEDGIWYFHIQFRNAAGWGEITHRKTLVDITPPEAFEIDVIEGEATTTLPKLQFASVDATSGLSRYEIQFGDEELVTLTVDEHTNLPEGLYQAPGLVDGTYVVTVAAIDQAGNETVAEVVVTLAAGIGKEQAVTVVPEDEDTGLDFKLIIIIILVLTIVVLLAFILWERHRVEQEHELLRHETKEIGDKMEKIFSVLQDELEEQIRNLDNKPRLSKSEKEVLDNLREALEISEAFIAKEIEDVEKILK